MSNIHPNFSVSETPGPLNGTTVLDLSTYIAGPYGCALLADLGAKVIKVEPPAGDNLRLYPSTLAQESRAFLGVNRSKRGLRLDLKHPDGKGVLFRLIRSADVLVHNFRPSVPPRLGITYEECKSANSRLIYCALTGFGDTGPLKDKAGYDQVLQSMTGICTLQGNPEEGPKIVYGSIVDMHAGSLVSSGVTAALFHRNRTGEGQYVGISLLRTALAMQSARFIRADSEPGDVDRDMRSGGITGIHPAREGYIYISANTPHFWNALCTAIGLPEMATDDRYDTIRKRARRAEEIVPRIREALKAKTALEWEEVFGERVPCSAVRSIEDMFDCPQVLAEGIVAQYDHPTVGAYRGMGKPIYFSATPGPAPFAAPVPGQHSAEILRESDYSDEEISQLRNSGVIA